MFEQEDLPTKPSDLDTYAKAVAYLSLRPFQMKAHSEQRSLGEAQWAAWSFSRLIALAGRQAPDDHILLGSLQSALDLMREYPTLVRFTQTDLKEGYLGTVYGQPAFFHSCVTNHMTGLLWIVRNETRLNLMWDAHAVQPPKSWHEFMQPNQSSRGGIFS